MKYPETLNPNFNIRVWGKKACFTNPAFKAEGTTYPIITPSAARGIFEAIFWKPQFHWEIREIKLIKPIQTYNMTINGLSKFGNSETGIHAETNRMQRHMTFLYDVEYELSAQIVLNPGYDFDVAKYRDMFNNRLNKGQCFRQPYFGISECGCFFEKVKAFQPAYIMTKNFNNILFDLKFINKSAEPIFYDAKMVDGVIKIPSLLYEEMIFGENK